MSNELKGGGEEGHHGNGRQKVKGLLLFFCCTCSAAVLAALGLSPTEVRHSEEATVDAADCKDVLRLWADFGAYSKLNEDVIDFVYVSESNKNGNRSNSSSNVTRVVFREKAPGSSLVSVNDGRFVETPVNHPTTTRSGAPSWALLSSVSTHFEGPAGLFLPTILSRGVVIVRTLPHDLSSGLCLVLEAASTTCWRILAQTCRREMAQQRRRIMARLRERFTSASTATTSHSSTKRLGFLEVSASAATRRLAGKMFRHWKI